MVSGLRIEGGTQILSAGLRKTIQSIKEIVGNHSEADIFLTLKETNMDPDETAQKLLNQDPFHEVKRKRDKKKELLFQGTGYMGSAAAETRKNIEPVGQGAKFSNYPDRNVRRGGYGRNALTDAGVSREFRVVRDNRTNQNANREVKPPVQSSTSTNEPMIANASEKSSLGAFVDENLSVGRHSSQSFDGLSNSHTRQAKDANVNSTNGKDFLEERRPSFSRMHARKPNDSQPHSMMSSNNSVVGLYSSSSDPVHVPSPDSRPAAIIGAIKREVGVVGVRRQSSQNSAKPSSAQTNSFQNSHLGREDPTSGESFRSFTAISRSDQPSQTTVPESAIANMSVSRSFMTNQYNSRPHQHVVHQKASQPNKEWKPKSSPKPSAISSGVIGTPANSASPRKFNDFETEADDLQDKLSRVNLSENQNVIIAAHIRVSETDRCRLIFGSFGTDFESSRNLGYQAVGGADDSCTEPSVSLPVSAPDSTSDDTSCSKPVDLPDDNVQNSGSTSPVSGAVFEHQLADKKESSSPQNMDNYVDIGLARENSPSYTPSESQQQQDHAELPSFSAYDPQTGYDLPYFRSTVVDTVRGQGLPSPQETLGSHIANSIPASSIALVQQQPPVAQMYPQVHVSHFANLMPYRQYLSPVYVPPMAMPGYSSNPTYAHPQNGSSYLLMPGGSSHVTSGVKYGIQQFKHVPTGSPTGFGNFTSPTGYAINAPGIVGSATGLEDSSRLKYKDGNLYVPNPQAETSEIWVNPRELPSMQSASYYNMPAQTTHATAYLQSHTGHTSFNAAAQSSHMQFPGLYHPPPQPGAIANSHHLGPALGGNVGLGMTAAAPGAQVGAYQQPQLGHLNWTGNF